MNRRKTKLLRSDLEEILDVIRLDQRIHLTLKETVQTGPNGVHGTPRWKRAQIDRHALEQHVNYAPWCLQASALTKKYPIVTGESPSAPTVSDDLCFKTGWDADSRDGIPVLVMRESRTRSLFSHACADKNTSKEGYSG